MRSQFKNISIKHYLFIFLLVSWKTSFAQDDYWKGMEALNCNRSEEAVKYFTACINKNPRDVKVLLTRSKAFLENYDLYYCVNTFKDSIVRYTKQIEINRDESELWTLYATKAFFHEAIGQYEAAIKDYSEVIEFITPSPYVYLDRGRVKEEMNDFEGAMKDYCTAIEYICSLRKERYDSYCPILCHFYLARGRLYLQKGEKSKAETDFHKVLEIGYDESGCCPLVLFYLGRKNKAKDWLRNRMRGECYDYEAICLYTLLGEYEEALKYLPCV